uniref:EF-hand domain-containing protein n=1 Tax=Piliocolobus tephrosceles TaxID=591936 RepID=A0A8C9H544_9PRIM
RGIRNYLTCNPGAAAGPRALRTNSTVRKERVVRPNSELGEQPPGHNQSFQYGQEAFLGKEDSKTLDQLTPDKSEERLGKIVDRIDNDGDGFVTTKELKTWIKRMQKRHIFDNVAKAKEEILENWNMFVGSQATNYGGRSHKESP